MLIINRNGYLIIADFRIYNLVQRKSALMSDILVDFWDYVTGEPNLAPVSIIENPFTEEDGKTYTILDNCHNELHNKPKQDDTKVAGN